MNTAVTPLQWTPAGNANAPLVALAAGSFIDVATTSTGRATHYNDRATQQAAERKAHADLLAFDRELYAALLTLPSLTDRSRQLGVRNLLSTTRTTPARFLDAASERALVRAVLDGLSVPRRLKLLDSLRVAHAEAGITRVNNARARKLILRAILGSARLDRWAVKYRRRLGRVLTHAWGQRTASILRSILSKDPSERNAKEIAILRREVARWADPHSRHIRLYECVGFVLGAHRPRYATALLEQYRAARHDLRAGIGLPAEVLEGLRGRFFPDISSAQVLEWSTKTLTRGDRIAVQRRAKEAGIEVQFDPNQHDATRLYIYALTMGMTEAIDEALDRKAREAADRFPIRYERLGILVDASGSMIGSDEQRLRPMASALALRDMLVRCAHVSFVRYAGGVVDGRLVRPRGDSRLAADLLQLVSMTPDAIYVISDGYENAPAGRFAEVVGALERIGVHAPIHHLNPVMAAERQGVRALAPGQIPTLAAHRSEGLGLAVLRTLLDEAPLRGLHALLEQTSIPLAAITMKEVPHEQHDA